jgi:hypothetical protein
MNRSTKFETKKFPDRKIVLLEGACCGYDAGRRNGGFVDTRVPGLTGYIEKAGTEKGRPAFDISRHGINFINFHNFRFSTAHR